MRLCLNPNLPAEAGFVKSLPENIGGTLPGGRLAGNKNFPALGLWVVRDCVGRRWRGSGAVRGLLFEQALGYFENARIVNVNDTTAWSFLEVDS